MRLGRATRRGSTSAGPFRLLGSISMPGRAPTARFIIGRMFTAWTAQRAGIKRGGRRDVAEASYRNRDGTHQHHMTESNILPYDGQAIVIDDHGAEFDWPAITPRFRRRSKQLGPRASRARARSRDLCRGGALERR